MIHEFLFDMEPCDVANPAVFGVPPGSDFSCIFFVGDRIENRLPRESRRPPLKTALFHQFQLFWPCRPVHGYCRNFLSHDFFINITPCFSSAAYAAYESAFRDNCHDSKNRNPGAEKASQAQPLGNVPLVARWMA